MNSLRAALMAQAAGLVWGMEEAYRLALFAQIEHGQLHTPQGLLAAGQDAEAPPPETLGAAMHPATQKALASRQGNVVVIPVVGTIANRISLFDYLFGGGVTSPAAIASAVEQAVADTTVKSVILAIDSPGGVTTQVTEAVNRILAVRGKGTPIIAQVVGMCASCAYWIGSAADEVVATPSALVGGIGVFMTHDDNSGMYEQEGTKRTFQQAGLYKTENSDTQPLSAEAEAHRLANVEAVMAQFAADVAKGRGVTPAHVRGEDYGQGRAYLAPLALTRGLVDRVRSYPDTLVAIGAPTDPVESEQPRRRSYAKASAEARLHGVSLS